MSDNEERSNEEQQSRQAIKGNLSVGNENLLGVEANAGLGLDNKVEVGVNVIGVKAKADASLNVLKDDKLLESEVHLGNETVGVGANAQLGLDNRLGVGAKVGEFETKAEANLKLGANNKAGIDLNVGGVKLDTGVSIGVDGIGAQALGLGFEIGKTAQIKTPFGNLKLW